MGERGKEIKSTNWLLQSTRGGVKYCTVTIVNDIPVTGYGARWVQDLWDNHLVSQVVSKHWGVHSKLI